MKLLFFLARGAPVAGLPLSRPEEQYEKGKPAETSLDTLRSVGIKSSRMMLIKKKKMTGGAPGADSASLNGGPGADGV